MKKMIVTMLMLTPMILLANPVLKVAVIDTGFNVAYKKKVNLCAKGHYDFVLNKPVIGKDNIGHGTDVALTVARNVKYKKNYCLVIYKVHDVTAKTSTIKTSMLAFTKALENGISIVNYSMTGMGRVEEEYKLLVRLEKHKMLIHTPSGNEGKNLDLDCFSYPACYGLGNIIVIGALNDNGGIAKYSNRGKIVHAYFNGKTIEANNVTYRHGTSIATARATAFTVNYILRRMTNASTN